MSHRTRPIESHGRRRQQPGRSGLHGGGREIQGSLVGKTCPDADSGAEQCRPGGDPGERVRTVFGPKLIARPTRRARRRSARRAAVPQRRHRRRRRRPLIASAIASGFHSVEVPARRLVPCVSVMGRSVLSRMVTHGTRGSWSLLNAPAVGEDERASIISRRNQIASGSTSRIPARSPPTASRVIASRERGWTGTPPAASATARRSAP